MARERRIISGLVPKMVITFSELFSIVCHPVRLILFVKGIGTSGVKEFVFLEKVLVTARIVLSVIIVLPQAFVNSFIMIHFRNHFIPSRDRNGSILTKFSRIQTSIA